MKYRKYVVIVGIIILFSILIFVTKNNTNDNFLFNGTQPLNTCEDATDGRCYIGIIATAEYDENKRIYIGYYNEKNYYIKGYTYDDLWVIEPYYHNDYSYAIDNNVKEEGLKAIQKNKLTFKYNDVEYAVDTLYNSLYIQENSTFIDIPELMDYFSNYIETEDVVNNITNIILNENDSSIYTFTTINNNIIKLNGLELEFIKTDKNSYDSFDILNENKCDGECICKLLKKSYNNISEYYDYNGSIVVTYIYNYNDKYYLIADKVENGNYTFTYKIYLMSKEYANDKYGIGD